MCTSFPLWQRVDLEAVEVAVDKRLWESLWLSIQVSRCSKPVSLSVGESSADPSLRRPGLYIRGG